MIGQGFTLYLKPLQKLPAAHPVVDAAYALHFVAVTVTVLLQRLVIKMSLGGLSVMSGHMGTAIIIRRARTAVALA